MSGQKEGLAPLCHSSALASPCLASPLACSHFVSSVKKRRVKEKKPRARGGGQVGLVSIFFKVDFRRPSPLSHSFFCLFFVSSSTTFLLPSKKTTLLNYGFRRHQGPRPLRCPGRKGQRPVRLKWACGRLEKRETGEILESFASLFLRRNCRLLLRRPALSCPVPLAFIPVPSPPSQAPL